MSRADEILLLICAIFWKRSYGRRFESPSQMERRNFCAHSEEIRNSEQI